MTCTNKSFCSFITRIADENQFNLASTEYFGFHPVVQQERLMTSVHILSKAFASGLKVLGM